MLPKLSSTALGLPQVEKARFSGQGGVGWRPSFNELLFQDALIGILEPENGSDESRSICQILSAEIPTGFGCGTLVDVVGHAQHGVVIVVVVLFANPG